MDPPTTVDPPTVRLAFKDAVVRRSKMLVSTNGNADQTYTNTLLHEGTPITSGVTYSIIDKPAGLTGQITVNEATGAVTFGKPALDKVNADGPQTVTIQTAYKGKTASYAFTVTDHFSPRDLHTSVVMGDDIYVIGGITRKVFVSLTSGTPSRPQISSNEVWRSSDGGLTWDQAAGGTRFTDRANHGSVVLDGVLYVIAGAAGNSGTTGRNDVWRSTDKGVSWSRVTSTGTSVPFPMDYAFSSAVLGTAMYVMGGSNSTLTRYDEVWQSTDRGVTWTQATNATDPKFSARSNHTSVVLGNAGAARLYVIGGFSSSSNDLDDVWQSGDGASWTQVNASAASGSKFPVRSDHSTAVLSDTVYVIAGDQGGAARRDVWTSGDKGATWTRATATANAEFPARRNHASAARGGALYVIGGSVSSTQLFNDVWKSTDGGASWVNVHANP